MRAFAGIGFHTVEDETGIGERDGSTGTPHQLWVGQCSFFAVEDEYFLGCDDGLRRKKIDPYK